MSPLSFLSSAYSNIQNTVNSKRPALSQITQDLESGNVSGAEQTFQSLLPSGTPIGSTGTVATDFAQLGKALSSGVVSQAQNALAQLSADLKGKAPLNSLHLYDYAPAAASAGLNLVG